MSTRAAVLVKAVGAWLILGAGVGLAITIAQLVGAETGAGRGITATLQAVLVSLIVVPAIVWLRRRRDRLSLAGIGLSPQWGGAAGVGVAVGLGVGLLVWAPAFAAGWLRVDRFDAAGLVTFLAVNTVVLLLFEALPEEMALRGYAWSTVRDRWSPWVATLVVTVLFCFSSALIGLVHSVSALALGLDAPRPSLAPGGDDPIVYFIQIILFGLALIAARRLPLPGALAAAIAFHVTQLTVNRVLLGGLGWIDSGVDVEFVAPDAIALVLAHIVLGGLCFVMLRRWLTGRSGQEAGRG